MQNEKNELVKIVRALPQTSGVYLMKDRLGQVIYVGKAKNLPNRLSNYSSSSTQPIRTERMIASTNRIDTISTLNESEALLLEANLNEELIDLYEDLKPHKKKLFNGEILFFLAQAYFNVERFEKSISTLMQIQKGNDKELYELYLLRCYSLTSTKYEINKKKLNQLKKSYFDKKQSHIDCFLLKNDFLSAKKVLHDLKSFESILHDFFER